MPIYATLLCFMINCYVLISDLTLEHIKLVKIFDFEINPYP
jgi:hypothetical protein